MDGGSARLTPCFLSFPLSLGSPECLRNGTHMAPGGAICKLGLGLQAEWANEAVNHTVSSQELVVSSHSASVLTKSNAFLTTQRKDCPAVKEHLVPGFRF